MSVLVGVLALVSVAALAPAASAAGLEMYRATLERDQVDELVAGGYDVATVVLSWQLIGRSRSGTAGSYVGACADRDEALAAAGLSE